MTVERRPPTPPRPPTPDPQEEEFDEDSPCPSPTPDRSQALSSIYSKVLLRKQYSSTVVLRYGNGLMLLVFTIEVYALIHCLKTFL